MSDRPGTRITLVYTSDPYSDLQPGAEGTVMFTDSIGTVHVAWDNGSTLGMVPQEDWWDAIAGNASETSGATKAESDPESSDGDH